MMKEFFSEVGGAFVTVFVWIAVFAGLGLLFGCSPKVVPEGRVSHDTVYIAKQMHDSVHVLDSVFIREYTRGDTVYVDRVKWRELWSEKEVHDTLYSASVDTLTVVVTEYRQTVKQQILCEFGRLFVWLVIGIAFFFIIWFFLRRGDPP